MKRTLPALLATAFAIVFPVNAQVVSGTIGGNVLDASNGGIPAARVTVTNQDTSLRREVVSGESGAFRVPALPPGMYRVTASHEGFKAVVVSDLELQIEQNVSLNLVLAIGTVSESVEVQASAVALQTDSATVGQVISQKPIVDLPLNGRNFLQLAALSAGVVPATGTTAESARIGRSEATVHVAGGRAAFSSYLIDGMEARGSRFGEATILPNPDIIQEFKIQRNFYSAEYGSSPAVISVSTRSGTNTYHGSLYEFLRNNTLDAPAYFDGAAPPAFRMNQFGGTAGGPIVRNRTFAFFGYEGRRQRLATRSFARVPTPELLSGTFPSAIRDPFNGNLPFAGNTIPQSRKSKVAQNFNKYILAPNYTGTEGNLTGTPSQRNDFDQYNVRVDHRFSDKDTMFGRYTRSTWLEEAPGLQPYGGTYYPLNGSNTMVEETHIFNPHWLNSFKAGYTGGFLASNLEKATRDLASELGLNNLRVLPVDYGLPRMSISGYSSTGHSINTFRNWTNTYVLGDTMNLVLGRHALTMGVDFRHNRVPQVATNDSSGVLTFSGVFTGNSVADYLLGANATASARSSGTPGDYRFTQSSAFVQDNFKVSRTFSLNIGLRYEHSSPFHELGGSEGSFDRTIPGLRLASPTSRYGVVINSPSIVVGGLAPGVVPAQWLNFAPRIGFAWSLNSKTVIRAGAGIFYAMNQQNDLNSVSANPAFQFTSSLTNSAGLIPRLMDTLFDNVSSAGLPTTSRLQVIDPERKIPYLEQISVDVQRELPMGMFFQIGYVGNAGHQLTGRQDQNQARLNQPGENLSIAARRPYSQFASIWEFSGGENSNYHAGTVTLERRFATGVGFLANYTIGKVMDTTSSAITDYSSTHQISNNRHGEYGRAAFDARQRFTSSISYELPFGPGKRFLTRKGLEKIVVAGWQLNSVITMQSGLPFSVFLTADRSNTGTIAQQRPNRIGTGILDSGQSPNRWFDTSAFVLNPLNTYGNSGRGILEQNGVKTVDLSFLKTEKLTEKIGLQFRAEIFNILDAANFGPPGTFLDGSNFGVVTTVGPARQVQFGLKLLF